MMKMSKRVRLSPSKQRNEDIWSVLQEANLAVNSDCFHIESLVGKAHSMFSVQLGEEKSVPWCLTRSAKKIIFRIFRNQTEWSEVEKLEMQKMKLLASQGLGANIVAEFENGIAYEIRDSHCQAGLCSAERMLTETP